VDSLAGAGRVGVVVESDGRTSNTVEVVILPAADQNTFAGDGENHTRSREVSDLTWVPTTSLVLVTDENDDVVRVADVKQQSIVNTIVLPSGAEPVAVAVAVSASGKTAVVAERGRAKAAVIDLTQNSVSSEIAVGKGPVAVAIGGNAVAVVNQQDDTVSVFSLLNLKQVRTVAVQHAPRGVAMDTAGARAYVTNQNSGSISVIDLAAAAVVDTIPLGDDAHPQAIQLAPLSPTVNVAVVSDPDAGPDGKLIIVELASKKLLTVSVNPDRSGGAGDLAVNATTVYSANQTGGSVSVAPLSLSGGNITVTPSTIKAGMGVRAVTVDALDKLLVAANQGSGNLTLISLVDNQVVGQIDAVRSQSDDNDDHADRERGAILPVVASIDPASAKAGASFSMTIKGSGLDDATGVSFVDPAAMPGNRHGHGEGNDDNQEHGPFGASDAGFVVSGVKVNATGTQVTVQVKIDAGHAAGERVVRVLTRNGESSFVASADNTFTITR
jgi:YVTN family beta-propeller protein